MPFKSIRCVLLTSILLTVSDPVFAGGKAGQVGIGLSATDIAPNFMVHIWATDNITIEPSFVLSNFSPKEDGEYTRYAPGLGLLYHWGNAKNIRPYAGFRGALDILSGGGNNYSDIVLGPVFGGEYFFSDHFSVSGEYQIQILITDDKLSPNLLPADATYENTAAFLSVHFYF